MALFLYLTVTVLGALAALLYTPLKQSAIVMGLTRPLESWENVHGLENRIVEDTVACEDVHYHAPTGTLYLGCVGDLVKASGWFPGADALEHPEDPARGTIVVVDTKTFKSQKLELVGFPGAFVPHGISIYSAPADPATVYIFAVNHVPNAAWTPRSREAKTASRIEVFVHSSAGPGPAPTQARHLRTVAHPLIWTPNDLLALSEREFLVTNDHRYLEGPLRSVEELVRIAPGRIGAWSNTAHVLLPPDDDPDAPPNVTIALDSIPTNNGLGWGPDGQVLLSDATGGGLYFGGLPDPHTRRIAVSHRLQTDGVVDNPSFYADADGGADYSGYVLAGAGRAVDFVRNFKDPLARAPMPSLVWYVPASAGRREGKGKGKEQVKLLFSDDGSSARGATTAVMVPIDPRENAGRREAWLFVTGLVAPHMLATRIDLEKTLG